MDILNEHPVIYPEYAFGLRAMRQADAWFGIGLCGSAGSIGGSGGSASFDPSDLWAGGTYAGFWADFDAAGAITYGTPPAIAGVACKGTLGDLAQATTSDQPDEASLGAKLSADFAVDEGLVLGSTKSTQRAFHDGTGVTVTCVAYLDTLAATRTLFSSADANTDAGVQCTVATNGAITYSVHNTTGTEYLTCTSAAGVIAPGVKAVVRIMMSTAGAYVYVDGQLVASDTSATGSPSTGDATELLTWGNLTDLSAGAVGRICDAYSVARVVSAEEGSQLDAFFATKHSWYLATDLLTEAELATWSGLQVWLDPTDASTLTYNTQPTLADGDMENVGVGDWFAGGGATLTKETSDPYEGARNIKIAYSGANNPNATSSICFIVGNRYTIQHTRRGYGAWLLSSGGANTFGSTSYTGAAWDTELCEGTAATAAFRLYCITTSANSAEWDDINLTNISLASITPRAGALSDAFTQATAASMPWIDSTTGAVRFDSTDKLISGIAKADLKFLHDGSGGTLVMVVNPDNLTNSYPLNDSDGSGDVGFKLRFASGSAYYAINKGGTAHTLTVANIASGSSQIFAALLDSSFLRTYVNGVADASTAVSGLSSADSTDPLTLGGLYGYTTYGMPGTIGDTLAFNRTLSASEHYRLCVFLATKHSITLP